MNESSYETLLPQILNISDEAIKQPNLPIATFIQEASDLTEWVREDIDELSTAGIDASIVETLLIQTKALIHAQSICVTQQLSTDQKYQQYQVERAQAETLRDELTTAFRFAFSDHPDLLKQKKSKRGRGSIAALVQDLYQLSILGKDQDHQEELSAIGFNLQQLDLAATSSQLLSQLHATVTQQKSQKTNNRKIRNKAYTLLKTTVEQVRAAGKYVFRNHPSRLRGYKSAHWARK
ncbi:hypothetical protein [Marinoscillum pacificum]|uniref:hypothetical protein n=1 Tax=Marinoscillum pacificum TaxID=392723 RepID=UPI00215737EC|nr:hypothetical protein [Marinoscillum pacificum]